MNRSRWLLSVVVFSLAGAFATAALREAAPDSSPVETEEAREPSSPAEAMRSAAAPPDYRRARAAQHHIERVTAYSDRARVSRTATVELKPGLQWIRFGSLPGNLAKDTLVVSPPRGFSGRIAQVILEDSFEHANLPEEVRVKVETLRKVYAEILQARLEEQADEQALQMVHALRYDAPFPRESAHQAYHPFTAKMDRLSASLDEVGHEAIELSQKKEKSITRLKELDDKARFLEEQLLGITSVADQKWMVQAYVLVDSPTSQKLPLTASYFVSSATWHPLYDVRADLDRAEGTCDLKLVTSALVEQHTGEPWDSVELTLSTLDPVPLYLPRLTRWTLKERRAEEPSDKTRSYEEGSLGGAAAAKEKNVVAKDEFAKRTSRGAPGAAPAAAPRPMMAAPAENKPVQMQAAQVAAGDLEEASANSDRDRLEDRKSPAHHRKGKESDAITASTSFPAERLDTIFPKLAEIERSITQWQGGDSPEAKIYSVETAPQAPPQTTYADSSLPAVQAKGRVLEFTSPFRVDLKSDEAAIKTPVTSQRLKGELSYLAIPKKDARVFLRAKAVNQSRHPLLAGAAQIFMDGDLVTRTNLSSIPEGGQFEIDLGVDRDVETKRVVHKSSESKGMLKSRHLTSVQVEIEVANHHPFPVSMEIRDNYPIAPDSKVEVALQQVRPTPLESKDGLLKWKLPVPANAKRTLTFEYQVSHPDNLLVSEFD